MKETTIWPEQDVVDAWCKKHSIAATHEQRMEIKKTLTGLRQPSAPKAEIVVHYTVDEARATRGETEGMANYNKLIHSANRKVLVELIKHGQSKDEEETSTIVKVRAGSLIKTIEMRCSAINKINDPNLVAGDPVFVRAFFVQVRSTSPRGTRKPKPGDRPDTLDDIIVTLRYGDVDVGQHMRMTVDSCFDGNEEDARKSG